MKHIRILHLYSNALDLYGDYKNLTVLQRRIAETGNTSDITEINLDEVIDPTGYDFVYIGHGKARNLAAVASHFVQYGDTIRTAIEGGQVWFVTGNARELFGQRFTTPTGETMPGIGLFDYTGVETNKVFVSDMLAQPVYDEGRTATHCLQCFPAAAMERPRMAKRVHSIIISLPHGAWVLCWPAILPCCGSYCTACWEMITVSAI